jgi:CheY-like chemotaxis protein
VSTVLLVDDMLSIRALLKIYLAEFKLEYLEAGDGNEALEVARKRRPDLVVSDVLMPKMKGDALVAALRNDLQLKDVPVILLSAITDREALPPLDARTFFAQKPISPSELKALVQAALGKAR